MVAGAGLALCSFAFVAAVISAGTGHSGVAWSVPPAVIGVSVLIALRE